MGCSSVISTGAVLLAVVIGGIIYSLNDIPQLPDIQVTYWGPGKGKPDDNKIRPFKIAIPDVELKYLNEKLNSTRSLVAPLEGVNFSYGMNTDFLKTIIEFWLTKYDWRKRESYLNSLPQYMTQIGGLDIHFIHAKPDETKLKGQQVIPLLLLHGWPGSVREFYEIIPLLTTPRSSIDFVFEVIAPSLPGYGYSQGASKPGMGAAHMGAVFDHLMARLGFKKYFVQGGDWGSVIGQSIAILYPERILGYHSNLCFPETLSARYRTLLAYMFPSLFVNEGKREQFINQFTEVPLLEMGYFHIQATKPDTVGVALTDSPVGLAAYVLEKFSTWTNKAFRDLPDGGLQKFKKESLLDNIMLYWFPKSITTSMRLYSETFNRKYHNLGISWHPVNVPTACAVFPQELLYFPSIVLEGAYTNLVSVSELSSGGHFGAFEEPAILADDIWKFTKTVRQKRKA